MQSIEEPVISRHRLTVEKYYRMAEVGVLDPDARVELIDGEVIDMAPMGSRHSSFIRRLTRLLVEATRDLASVSVQTPLRLDRYNEPQPDFMLLKVRADDYAKAHPGAADTLLVIEVADSTLGYDLRTKARLYAQHRVPAYWVFDLKNGALHVHASPSAQGYRRSETLRNAGSIAVPGVANATLDLSGLL